MMAPILDKRIAKAFEIPALSGEANKPEGYEKDPDNVRVARPEGFADDERSNNKWVNVFFQGQVFRLTNKPDLLKITRIVSYDDGSEWIDYDESHMGYYYLKR